MTEGSTNALHHDPPSLSSNKANTKDTTAEARRMRTNWSLNCSSMSSQSGVGGSSGSSGETQQLAVQHSFDNSCVREMLTVLAIQLCMFCGEIRGQTTGRIDIEML